MPTTARKLARYLPPALGQIGSAGAQFVLSLQLLHSLSPEKFGVFAFLMIALQLGFGISTAVLCAPYPLVLGRSEGPEEQRSINRAFATGNLLYALMGACVMALCGLRFSLETGEYLLLFAFSGAMFLRWFARAFSYASARPLRAAASDILYGAVVLVGVALIRTLAGVSLSSGFFLMLTARWPGSSPSARAT